MTKRIRNIIYYVLIILLFIFIDRIINMVPSNRLNELNILKEENRVLKEDIVYLSNLTYENNYEICKISINDLYSSNTYFINCNFTTTNNIVLNNIGFIGIANNNKITLGKDLILSIRINNNKGILKDNKINIIHDNYNIGDKVYVRYLNEEYLIGYVSNIIDNSSYDIISIKYIDINSSYVVVIT